MRKGLERPFSGFVLNVFAKSKISLTRYSKQLSLKESFAESFNKLCGKLRQKFCKDLGFDRKQRKKNVEKKIYPPGKK